MLMFAYFYDVQLAQTPAKRILWTFQSFEEAEAER